MYHVHMWPCDTYYGINTYLDVKIKLYIMEVTDTIIKSDNSWTIIAYTPPHRLQEFEVDTFSSLVHLL